MTTISPRYAPAIIALALVAAIPVAIHSKHALDRDDCRDPGVMRAVALIPGSSPSSAEGPRDPSILQRSMGTLNVGHPRDPFRFAIMRSLKPLRILNRPERLIAKSFEAQSSELRWAERDGERLPIHWVESGYSDHPVMIGYTYLYGQRAVAHARLALLASGPRRLFTGARPMTILAAGGSAHGDRERMIRGAEDWFFAAWHHYREACGPEGGAARADTASAQP
jgi:hypothetical protein